MQRVLVAGCSFLHIKDLLPFGRLDKINYQKYKIIGDEAAGNLAIAARVRHEVSKQPYEHVVVLWSGINRIDIEKPKHNSDDVFTTYPYVLDFDDAIWFMSGGICGSWHSACPEPVKSEFHSKFLHQTPRLASDITLSAVVGTQKFLSNRGIDYTMSFIYDIHRDYNCTVDLFGNRNPRIIAKDRWPQWLALEHCLGQVDRSSEWYDKVDWAKFPARQAPFEYCADRNMLRPDRFHPTKDGIRQWFSRQLNIDLTDY